MTEKFMRLVIRALYVLILMNFVKHPYLEHGRKIDRVLIDLDDFLDS